MDFFPQNNENNFYYQPISVFGSLQELPDDIQNMMEQAVAVRKKSICLFKIPSRRSSPVRQWTNCSRLKSRKRCISFRPCAERVFSPGLFIPKNFKMAITAASDSIKQ
jgi:cytidine deaminase